jgi:hypothetical protein
MGIWVNFVLPYIITAICTGLAFYIFLVKYEDFTEEKTAKFAIISGIFWPLFFLTLIIKRIIIYLK